MPLSKIPAVGVDATGTPDATTFFRGDNTWATPITSGTAVSTTSGTLWDFTGIPTTAKRVTVMYRSLSTNGTSIMQIQLGTTSGIEATGYSSVIETASSRYASAVGFQLTGVGSTTWSLTGTVVLTLLNSTNNTWVANILAADGLASAVYTGGGYKLTSGALSQLRITTVNGTDTFDAGTVNILWE